MGNHLVLLSDSCFKIVRERTRWALSLLWGQPLTWALPFPQCKKMPRRKSLNALWSSVFPEPDALPSIRQRPKPPSGISPMDPGRTCENNEIISPVALDISVERSSVLPFEFLREEQELNLFLSFPPIPRTETLASTEALELMAKFLHEYPKQSLKTNLKAKTGFSNIAMDLYDHTQHSLLQEKKHVSFNETVLEFRIYKNRYRSKF
jgi:hypothetical protein